MYNQTNGFERIGGKKRLLRRWPGQGDISKVGY